MTELLTAFTFGLGAGLAPGPLQAVVITSTLQRGFGAGWRVAMGPLVTDSPIIALSIAALSAVPGSFLNGLAVAGGLLLVVLGLWELRWRRSRVSEHEAVAPRADLWRGALVNLANPHPWIFWLGAGATLIVTAWRRSPALAVAVLVVFYSLLIGLKVLTALAVARGADRLDAALRARMAVAGAALLALGGGLIVWQGAAGRFG
jgi:threonine/homoserine/homoserine lactone efflux protein